MLVELTKLVFYLLFLDILPKSVAQTRCTPEGCWSSLEQQRFDHHLTSVQISQRKVANVEKYQPKTFGFQLTYMIRNQREVLRSKLTVLSLLLGCNPNLQNFGSSWFVFSNIFLLISHLCKVSYSAIFTVLYRSQADWMWANPNHKLEEGIWPSKHLTWNEISLAGVLEAQNILIFKAQLMMALHRACMQM